MPVAKKTQQNYKFRELFLTEFVKTLVNNSITPEEIKKIKREMVLEKERTMRIQSRLSQEISQQIPDEIHMMPSMMGQFHPAPMQFPISPPKQQPNTHQAQNKETINLGKLTQILLDPSVISIECPGPEKNVLVNRSDRIQASSTTLTKEEISMIMDEISDKTRIPYSVGVFKAAFQDLLITAVVSEYVGIRFIIQKRNPFQKY